MKWLSPNQLAFEWETTFGKVFPWGYQEVGKKRVLVIAEEGKNLFFLGNGENSGYSGRSKPKRNDKTPRYRPKA